MSMSRGCVVVEQTESEWYCCVARAEYDYDFCEFDCFGPVATESAAVDCLEAVSNPGSIATIRLTDPISEKTLNRINEMIAHARRPTRSTY